MLEIEAKFQVASPQVLETIRSKRQVAGYTLSHQESVPQQDTYLDSANGLLLRRGASLRLRRRSAAEERTYFVTFKTPAPGIYTRTELEVPITERQAQLLLTGNLEAIHEEVIETAVTHLEGAKIYPVLHVENIRETWRIETTSGCVEICFDDVRYADADRTRCVREYGIELELKAGEVAFLQQIADALSKQSYFIPAFQSKYERGAALLGGIRPLP